MVRAVSFTPYGGDTIKALQERQAALQEAAPQLPGVSNLRSGWQGASYLANTLVNTLQQNAAASQEHTARTKLAELISNHVTGTPWKQEEIANIYQIQPELGQHIMDLEEARATAEAKQTADATGAPKRTDIASLADDFSNVPDVKNYQNAQSMWVSMQDAATRNTAQADLNMVIAMAKLFDPGSVVRSEEGKAVELTGNLPANVMGWFSYLTGKPGSRLSRDVRQGMMQEAYSRMNGYYSGVQQASQWYTDKAKRGGYNPDDIVRPFPQPQAFDPDKVVGAPAVATDTDPAPPTPPADPNPPEVQNDPQYKAAKANYLSGGGTEAGWAKVKDWKVFIPAGTK
jgi:hypothetical protein